MLPGNRDERPAEVGKASRVGDPGVPYRDSVSYEEKDFCDEEEEVEDCPFNVVNDLPSELRLPGGAGVEEQVKSRIHEPILKLKRIF